jgi:hypothetical protein
MDPRRLRGEHLNMPERLALGLWPHPPIPFEAVLQHLTDLLQENKWFPREYHEHRAEEPVDERATSNGHPTVDSCIGPRTVCHQNIALWQVRASEYSTRPAKLPSFSCTGISIFQATLMAGR